LALMKSAVAARPSNLLAPEYRNSTANSILPKVMKAGMVGPAECCNDQVAKRRNNYGRFAPDFQTLKPIQPRQRPSQDVTI
jgi:hypothetical protein